MQTSYTPISRDQEPLPPRTGHQHGAFIVARATPQSEWQLDHIATGSRLLPSPNWPFERLGYNRLRRIAARLGHLPQFQFTTLPTSRETRAELRTLVQSVLDETR